MKFLRAQSFLKKRVFPLSVLILFLFLFQFIYFFWIYSGITTMPSQDFDLVLSYSDETSMKAPLNLSRSRDVPLFVSLAPWEHKPFQHRPASQLKKVNLDATSATTDQNARRSASFIKRGGFKKVALDVGWFHLPRSLFLTRLYLMGSGVEVMPCAKTPLPEHWWTRRVFYTELYKFWGSLGRVILDFFGWETGPVGGPPSNMANLAAHSD